jgi:broad specificity phosphatase PhoE
MTLKLYLLRHGETEYSLTGGYCGITDVDLTPEGHKMAQGFADCYKEMAWEAIYCSPMQRTLSTAKPIAEALGIELNVREGLREMDFGAWEGQSTESVQQHYTNDYLRWLTEPAWNPPTEGETGVQVSSRAMPVIAEIQDKHPTGNVLVVSHKTTIRLILCNLLGIDLGRYRDRITALAASLSLVSFDVHGPMLEILGDRYHIPEDLRDRLGT